MLTFILLILLTIAMLIQAGRAKDQATKQKYLLAAVALLILIGSHEILNPFIGLM